MSDTSTVILLSEQDQKLVFLISISIYLFLWIICKALIFGLFKSYESVQKRGVLLVAAQSIGNLFFTVGVLLGIRLLDAFNETWRPIVTVPIFTSLGAFIYLAANFILCINYTISFAIANLKLMITNDETEYRAFGWRLQAIFGIFNLLSGNFRRSKGDGSIGNSQSKSHPSGVGSISSSHHRHQSQLTSVHQEKGGSKAVPFYLKMRGRISDRSTLFVLAIVMVLSCLLTIASQLLYDPKTDNQGVATPMKWIIVIFSLFYDISILIMFMEIKGFKDSLGIKAEIISTFVIFCTMSLGYAVVEHINVPDLARIQNSVGSYIFMVPIAIFAFLVTDITVLYQCFKERAYLGQDQGRKRNFADLLKTLQDPMDFESLKVSMKQDLCVENAIFISELMRAYRDCNKTFTIVDIVPQSSQLHPANETSATLEIERRLVMRIYRDFIKTGSPNELNISSDMRAKISSVISVTDSLKINLGLLDGVRDEICHLIYMNNYMKWKNNRRGRME